MKPDYDLWKLEGHDAGGDLALMPCAVCGVPFEDHARVVPYVDHEFVKPEEDCP